MLVVNALVNDVGTKTLPEPGSTAMASGCALLVAPSVATLTACETPSSAARKKGWLASDPLGRERLPTGRADERLGQYVPVKSELP